MKEEDSNKDRRFTVRTGRDGSIAFDDALRKLMTVRIEHLKALHDSLPKYNRRKLK